MSFAWKVQISQHNPDTPIFFAKLLGYLTLVKFAQCPGRFDITLVEDTK